jgi:hypothetical protein
MHAALFRADWVTPLPVRHFGETIESVVEQADLLPQLLTAACEARLDPVSFARLWRFRRRFAPYLRGLLRKADLAQRPLLALMICRSVVQRMGAPRYRRRMHELEARLGLPSTSTSGDGNSDIDTPGSSTDETRS